MTGVYCNRRNIFWTSVVHGGEKPTTFRRKSVCVLSEGLLCHYPPVIGTRTERAGVCYFSIGDFPSLSGPAEYVVSFSFPPEDGDERLIV